MNKNDGGPAFPIPYATDMDGYVYAPRADGMSLRDWFAGMALQGILASFPPDANFATQAAKDALAADSYDLADAMIAERKKDE